MNDDDGMEEVCKLLMREVGERWFGRRHLGD